MGIWNLMKYLWPLTVYTLCVPSDQKKQQFCSLVNELKYYFRTEPQKAPAFFFIIFFLTFISKFHNIFTILFSTQSTSYPT